MKNQKQINVYDYFSDFYENKAIKQIANTPQWTVSTKDKIPINAKKVIDSNGTVFDNCYNSYTDCVTLYEITNAIPNSRNVTYFLDTLRDKIVVLDIEPSCSKALKRKFLNLPYMYAEISMSGKGYHLIFKLPDIIKEYPDVLKQKAMQNKKDGYEILLCHPITFTRNTKGIPPSNNSESFIKVFEDLAKEQKFIKINKINIENLKPDKIILEDYIISLLIDSPLLNKSLEDYNNDVSSYEMAEIAKLIFNFSYLLKHDELLKASNHKYTDNEIAWLVYEALIERIEYREKHDTLRNGMPYLLYSISRSIGMRKAEKEEKIAENKRLLQAKVDAYNKKLKRS